MEILNRQCAGTRSCVLNRRRDGARRAFLRVAFLLLTAAVSLQPLTAKLGAQSREYDLKAAFLYNFAHFCDWPPESFNSTNSPLVIGVLGEDPFGQTLDDLVRGETVQGRKIEVHRYRSVAEITSCQILFIAREEAPRCGQIITLLNNRPVLTVSDMDGFAYRGGMIRFITEQKKIRLRIDVSQVRKARLAINSKVLNLAEVVDDLKGN